MSARGAAGAGAWGRARAMAIRSRVARRIRRLRTLPLRTVVDAKLKLPTGAPFDDTLNYLHAWIRLGYMPHIARPRSFNEHVLACKRRFFGDIELGRRVTDKALFKEWLREKGYGDLVVPTLGVYDDMDEIRDRVFERHTILKPTHMSGPVIAFHSSRKLTSDELSKSEKWLNTDYYRNSREKTYKGLRKRLIHEAMLLDTGNGMPMDYKFFMCSRTLLMIQLDIDRFGSHTQQFYSADWELLDFGLRHPRSAIPIERPETLDTALEIAAALSEDFPLCRVDLYLLPGGVHKAGEITFFPHGGCGEFYPLSADFALGVKVKELLRQ